MPQQITAKIVADSISPQNERLITMELVFPRIILAEINTHRMLSKNTSSSRAIPFNKMVEAVEKNPFIPIAWQKEHKGMQGSEYLEDENIGNAISAWLTARDYAVMKAKELNEQGHVTKQLCNRLLEPFMWCTVLVTGNKESFDNMFDLRCPSYEFDTLEKGKLVFKSWKEAIRECSNISKTFTDNDLKNLENTTVLEKLSKNKGQAEIHLMDLAEKMYDDINESTPEKLESGQWHIPYWDKLDMGYFASLECFDYLQAAKIVTAMAAKTSYTSIGDEQKIDYEKLLNLHDRLLEMKHMSPFEHCCKVMTEKEYYEFSKGQDGQKSHEHGWSDNFKGFISYRHLLNK